MESCEVPGIIIPEDTRQRLNAAGDDVPQEGVRIAVEDIQGIRAWVNGIYIMPPFNRFDLAAEIIETVKS